MPSLAALVRAKFPGVYDDLPDAALEAQVLAKHPEYQDLATPALQTVSKDEPDTYWGGVAQSVAKTAKDVGAGVVRGVAQTFDPRTYVSMMAAKDAADHPPVAVDPFAQPVQRGAGDYGVSQLKALGQSLATPAGGGEAIGGLLAAGALGRVGPPVAAGLKRGGLRLMQSALKPTKALENARAGAGFGSKQAIAQAVLDEGRIVSPGSAAKAQDALDATDAAAHDRIQAGAGHGVTVDPFQVTDAIDRTAGPTGAFGRQINAQPDTTAIRGVHEAFATNPYVSDPVTGMAPMDAELAHDFAINTGKNLKGKFGRLGGATVEAEKAGREAITGQLRAKIPELAPLWTQEARQITTRDALDQAVARRANTDPIGLSSVVGAVRNPQLAAVAMADRSALLKSMAAQGLNTMARSSVTPAALRAAILARLMKATEHE